MMLALSKLRRQVLATSFGVALVATIGLTGGDARADPAVAACVEAYEKAQLLRKRDDYLGAREQLLICAASTCPMLVQNDCVDWSSKIEDSIPGVVFEGKVNGSPVFDVAVSMDGKPLVKQLDGKSVDVNPGLHTFTFTRAGAPPREEKAIVRRGEKSHLVTVSWTTVVPPTSSAIASPPPVSRVRPIPPLFWALGAASVAGFGGFLGLAIAGKNQEDSLAGSCHHNCSNSSVDNVRSLYAGADISGGVAAVALISAGIVFFTRPERIQKTATGFSHFDVAATGSSAFFNWRAQF